MRPIFDALSTELKALDPCVTEEFTKLYVAYKAETNFVDVVPRANHLGLTMNLEFQELNDLRAIARDVTEIDTWGKRRCLRRPRFSRQPALRAWTDPPSPR